MEQVTGALKDVNLGMSKKRAALKWKIPRSSLQHYIKTGSDGDCRPGPPSILTNTAESLLAEWLSVVQKRNPCCEDKLTGQCPVHNEERWQSQSFSRW